MTELLLEWGGWLDDEEAASKGRRKFPMNEQAGRQAGRQADRQAGIVGSLVMI